MHSLGPHPSPVRPSREPGLLPQAARGRRGAPATRIGRIALDRTASCLVLPLVLAFFSQACVASPSTAPLATLEPSRSPGEPSSPTAGVSPTLRATSTPTRRATSTPTLRPTATPDLNLAGLRLEDLPAGFESFQPADIGLNSALLGSVGLAPWSTFGFRHPSRFHFVVGFASWLPDPAAREAFDKLVHTPEPLAIALLAGAGTSQPSGIQPLTGFEDLADSAGAVTGEFVYAGFPFRADLVLFRQGPVGALLLVGRPTWDSPLMDPAVLATLFHARIETLIE
jgi:hypothetical protein